MIIIIYFSVQICSKYPHHFISCITDTKYLVLILTYTTQDCKEIHFLCYKIQ